MTYSQYGDLFETNDEVYHVKANPNATNSELDAKVIITYDATNQPEDWEDFWHRSIDLYPTKEDS